MYLCDYIKLIPKLIPMRVTFKPYVRLQRLRKDKTYCVYIRIGYNSKYAYIETKYSASKSDLKGSVIKSGAINDKCNILISEYRTITDSMPDIESKDILDIVEYIKHREEYKNGIDFLLYFRKHVDKLVSENAPSKQIYSAAYNHFKKFTDRDSLSTNGITSKLLKEFDEYLVKQKVGSHGIHSYMSKIRAVFNMCIDDFEELGYTFSYPFRKYKLPKVVDEPTIALTKEQLQAIRDIELKEDSRANYVRNTFMVSLLSLGTNASDLYDMETIRNNRLEYCRNKTRNRRTDQAFISILIESELLPYIQKLQGQDKYIFNYREKHINKPALNNSIRDGVKEIADAINIYYKEKEPKKYAKQNYIQYFDFYDARRTLASVMRNTLGISKDDVGLCLNHEDSKEHKATNYYIEKDFSILDRCNRKFIDWLYS